MEFIMDWFCTYIVPITTMLATVVLACFTIVLANATKNLYHSTERYANASEELVRVTELSTKATANMANIEQLNLVRRIFDEIGSKLSTHDNRLPTFDDVIGLIDDKGTYDDNRVSEFMNSLAKKYEKLIKNILEYEQQGSAETNNSDAP